jgi:hypothetical protein
MKKFFIIVLSLSLACHNEPTAPAVDSVAGTWTMQSMNGLALPFLLVKDGPNMSELITDALTFDSSGNFTELASVRTTHAGLVTTESITYSGLLVLDGATASVKYGTAGASGSGTLKGNALTIVVGNYSSEYVRQ